MKDEGSAHLGPVYSDHEDPTDLGAREAQAQEDRRLAKFFAQQAADDLASVMSTRQGRRFVWQLIDVCGLWRLSFTPSRRTTEYMEGQRSIALMLWGRLQDACPELMTTMLEEHK